MNPVSLPLAAAIISSALTLTASNSLPPDVVDTQEPGRAPIPPLEALTKMEVPEGFRISLFAGEPHVHQPIAMEFDHRGRLWVVECFGYPEFKFRNRDRILIFEDTDHDGRFDERKIFYDRGDRFTGLQFGYGGVFVTAAPYLLFLPDQDADDRPDGEPEILLDGFTLEAQHNFVNGLAWGPDGWLWGRHGILSESQVGIPGSDEPRTRIKCGIWRYHPTHRRFEVVAHGTTNPWGLDFDQHGQAFFSNNVIGHLFHVFPGARYERMYGEDYNPHSYELMKACSDHLHWTGGVWQEARGGPEHDSRGGGHSHSGAMIYLGDNWPDQYRGACFMNNIHGNRLLFDHLDRNGSGYVGRHGGDFLTTDDRWFRGIDVLYGPDGGVYVSDWNDFGECHDNDGSFRSSGRIYKITYGTPEVPTFDFSNASDDELLGFQSHRNEWFVRQSRRGLSERAHDKTLESETPRHLERMLTESETELRKLRSLWCVQAVDAATEKLLLPLLADEYEHVRAWAVRLLLEENAHPPSPSVATALARRATIESSPLVRATIASALQRISPEYRWPIAEGLITHSEDQDDPNIPLLLWYAIEPSVATDRRRAVNLMRECRIPKLRRFIARRLSEPDQAP